jgi:hypothetical protein
MSERTGSQTEVSYLGVLKRHQRATGDCKTCSVEWRKDEGIEYTGLGMSQAGLGKRYSQYTRSFIAMAK